MYVHSIDAMLSVSENGEAMVDGELEETVEDCQRAIAIALTWFECRAIYVIYCESSLAQIIRTPKSSKQCFRDFCFFSLVKLVEFDAVAVNV